MGNLSQTSPIEEDTETQVLPPSAYCNMETTYEQEEEKVLDDEFLDPTCFEGMKLHSSREEMG